MINRFSHFMKWKILILASLRMLFSKLIIFNLLYFYFWEILRIIFINIVSYLNLLIVIYDISSHFILILFFFIKFKIWIMRSCYFLKYTWISSLIEMFLRFSYTFWSWISSLNIRRFWRYRLINNFFVSFSDFKS